MTAATPQRSRWHRPGRWFFIVCVVVSLIIITLATRQQLRLAEMSLGTAMTLDTASTFTSSIINRKTFVPPKHGMPTTAQISFALRMARLDSMQTSEKVSMARRQAAFAREFNTAVMSLSEYRWIAATLEKHYAATVAVAEAPFHEKLESRLLMIDDLLLQATNGNIHRLTAMVEELGG